MKCPGCGAENMSLVIETRDKGDKGIYRRRKCIVCGYRFSSMEKVVRSRRRRRYGLGAVQENDDHGKST